MFWQSVCLLDVPQQCYHVCTAHAHTHTSHLCLHNCSQCLHWASWVSTDKSLAWFVPEIVGLTQDAGERILHRMKGHHMACCGFLPHLMVDILKESELLLIYWRGIEVELTSNGFLLRVMSIRVFSNVCSASKTGNILTLWLHKDVLVRSMQGSVFDQEHYSDAIAANSQICFK